MQYPRIIISALRGGAGKTLVSLGIAAAWRQHEIRVSPFKKGPDYIDAEWLTLAAGKTCHHLDTFLMKPEVLIYSFLSNASGISLIEGNRGLYDGTDMEGATSTAELAKLLSAPVIMCIDCTKSTRTMAAAVLGCIHFDPNVRIRGVILNRVARARHENILQKSIEYHCGIPVVGAVPKLHKESFPERHMGLVPTAEHRWTQDSVNAASQIAEQYLDLNAIARIARNAPNFQCKENIPATNMSPLRGFSPQSSESAGLRIGVVRDSAFQFYYPENIEMLVSQGAEIVFLNALKDLSIPAVDAIYIGGGFPETHADKLAENAAFRNELKVLAERGLPIYAECGGLMYLGEELILDGISYPMAGVLPIIFGFSKRPQGHGYTVVSVERENPYFKVGAEIRGHEFHYSNVLEWRGNDEDMAFSMKRGTGICHNRDGICYKNVLATYTHIHSLGTPEWAEAMVRNAAAYRSRTY